MTLLADIVGWALAIATLVIVLGLVGQAIFLIWEEYDQYHRPYRRK